MLVEASRNDASLLKAEVTAAPVCRGTDDDVIDQLELKDSAGFESPAGEPQIGLGRGGIAAGVIVHHDESEGAEGDDRFEDFPRVSQGFVERSLAYGNHLDELLLGVNKHNAQRFVTKKAHFGAEFRYRHGRVDQEPRAFLAQGDRGQAQGAGPAYADVIGKEIQTQNYACAVHDEAFRIPVPEIRKGDRYEAR